MNEMKKGDIKLIRFDCDFQQVSTNKYVDTNCNSITFINYGVNQVQIESVILLQTQQLTIDGNAGEYTEQRFLLNFGTAAVSGNNVVVIRKRYINVD